MKIQRKHWSSHPTDANPTPLGKQVMGLTLQLTDPPCKGEERECECVGLDGDSENPKGDGGGAVTSNLMKE